MKKTLFFTLFYSFLFFSCQEKTKGCLDPLAKNFSIGADNPCDEESVSGCPCEYPKFNIGFFYGNKVKNTNMKDTLVQWTNSVLMKNNLNQIYTVKNIYLYLSDIQLIKKDKSIFYSIDSVVLPIKISNKDSFVQKVRKDFTLMNSNNSSIEIGTIKEYGQFEKLKFKIGLQNPVNQCNSFKKNQIPVAYQSVFGIDSSLYLNNSYEHYSGLIAYKSDTAKASPTKKILFKDQLDIELLIPANVYFSKATDLRAVLNFECNKLLQDVDFQKDTADDIRKKVVQNLTKCWQWR